MLGAFCLLRVPSGGLEPEQAPRRAELVDPNRTRTTSCDSQYVLQSFLDSTYTQ